MMIEARTPLAEIYDRILMSFNKLVGSIRIAIMTINAVLDPIRVP